MCRESAEVSAYSWEILEASAGCEDVLMQHQG